MPKFKTGIDKSQLLWAVLCIIGFGIWQFVAFPDFFGTVNIAWVALSIIGLAGMYFFMKSTLVGVNKPVFNAWVIVVVLGEILSVGIWLGPLAFLMTIGINYGVIWAGLMGIGFLYTGLMMKNRPAQYVAGVLCLAIMVAMILQVPPIAGLFWAFVPLGLASGIPMIYDAWFS